MLSDIIACVIVILFQLRQFIHLKLDVYSGMATVCASTSLTKISQEGNLVLGSSASGSALASRRLTPRYIRVAPTKYVALHKADSTSRRAQRMHSLRAQRTKYAQAGIYGLCRHVTSRPFPSLRHATCLSIIGLVQHLKRLSRSGAAKPPIAPLVVVRDPWHGLKTDIPSVHAGKRVEARTTHRG